MNAPHPADSLGSVKPPASLETERELLGAVLADNSCTAEAMVCEPHWFTTDRHRAVFEAMRHLVDKGVPVDVVTVSQALKDLGTWHRAGEMPGVTGLLDRSGTSSYASHYAAILRDKALRRQVLERARRIEAIALGDAESLDALKASVVREYEQAAQLVAPPEPAPEPLKFATVGELSHQLGQDFIGDKVESPKSLLTHGGRPFMRMGRVGLVVAPGGTGKSFALMQLALSVATGSAWLNTYDVPSRGRVLLACGEEDLDEVRRRLQACAEGLSEWERALVSEHLVPLGLAGTRTAFLERREGSIVPTPWYGQFLAALEGHEWRAIILDPLSRWGGPEVETDAYAATQLVELLEGLAKLDGHPAIIAAHHERKGMGGTSDASSVRGSSALVDGPRWVANLRRRKDSQLLELEVTKANNTVPAPPLLLTRTANGPLRAATPDEIARDAEARDEKPKPPPKRVNGYAAGYTREPRENTL